MKQNNYSKLLSLAFIALASIGCVRTLSSDVSLNSPPDEDRAYSKIYELYTRNQKVIDDFETRYVVTATYLSPDFRTAFAKRFEQIFKEPQPVLEEASAKAGFFVTMFSAKNSGYDLDSSQLWNIQMQVGEQKLKPSLIKRLNDKERWLPFFADVNPWSKEYLLLFDTPSVTPASPDLVEKNPIKLNFSNADAHVTFRW